MHIAAHADQTGEAMRIAEADIKRHCSELLSWVGLAEHLTALPATLSGGQQQRVAIARAVIARPKLLLADEPTGTVDDHIAQRLMHLFDELNKLGTSIVIATHNEAMVRRSGRKVLKLAGGELRVLDNVADDDSDEFASVFAGDRGRILL